MKLAKLIFLGNLLSCLGTNPVFAQDLNTEQVSPVQKLVSTNNVEHKDLIKWVSNIKAGSRAERNIFLDDLKSESYDSALFQWKAAFGGTSFADSDEGQALFSILLFKVGAKVLAIENLFGCKNPQNLNKALVNFLKKTLSSNEDAWGIASITWTPEWSKIFDRTIEAIVVGKELLANFRENSYQSLLAGHKFQPNQTAPWQMQYALNLINQDKISNAAQVLKELLVNKQTTVGSDLINMTIARLLYQEGHLDEALKHYRKIPEGSDFWFEAREETAWSLIRKGDPSGALGITQGLTHNLISNDVGPESIYLHALVNLKICDYPEVMRTLNSFKTRFQPRLKLLKALSETGNTEASRDYIEKIGSHKWQEVNWGKTLEKMPRFSHRDQSVVQTAKIQMALENEIKIISDLYQASLSGASSQIGYQGFISNLKKKIEPKIQNARASSFARIKKLAADEADEVVDILKKMQLVEAEVIQQVVLVDQSTANQTEKEKKSKLKELPTSMDQLAFPYEGELWFDEINQYRVSLKKGCQVKE